MNFASAISESVWTEVSAFSLLAALGGVVVIVGLVLEWKTGKQSEKEWFSDMDDFWKGKHKSKCGEILVIIGVVIEVVIGMAFAGHDVWEKHKINDAIRPKPLNVRVMGLLNKIDPEILHKLASDPKATWFKKSLTQREFDDLWRLQSEPRSWDFFQISGDSSVNMRATVSGLIYDGIEFVVYTNVFDGSEWLPP